MLASCSQYRQLANEIKQLKTGLIEYQVQLQEKDEISALILIFLSDKNPQQIDGFDVVIGERDIKLNAPITSRYLFIFDDLNSDLRFQKNEPFQLKALDLQHPDRPMKISLTKASSGYPTKLVDMPIKQITKVKISPARIGFEASLSDPKFDKDKAELGMWKPLTHLQEGNAGLFFLTPFDKEKIPVILVHGIAGTARDFEPFIENIDTEKYQVWVFNYPTGLPLLLIAKGLENTINIVKYQYKFTQFHLLGHSMGGLVSKAYLNLCTASSNCDSLLSFTSISSPFGGVNSAQIGIDYSPVVMPVWRDLPANSKFIQELYTPSEIATPHMLNFGFKISGLLNRQSGDGVISLASQLDMRAQQEAELIRGYDEDHLQILSNKQLQQNIAEFWEETETKRAPKGSSLY
ncbi:alpha/beta hydrolase [Shewanella nanhaiensis]|uniref:Alpha/beta hydrolase n=1 Tax=Shewanella nanhaiensis TaxID=2864872 RepID=A0ABS7E1B7_9GAMM|nr:alpha/beta hydrolase [Shewanella nanhaiensis]MBW8182802.1 alpha/beta hydrolase [Shewanella nanhaiensis]